MRAGRVGDEPHAERHLLRSAADPDLADVGLGQHGSGGGQPRREPRLRHRREGQPGVGALVRRRAPLEVDVGCAQASDRGRDRSARERLRGEQRQRHRREVHRRRQVPQAMERSRREVDRGRRRAGLCADGSVQRRWRVQLQRRQAHGLRRELPGSMVGPRRLRAAFDSDRREHRYGQLGQPDRGGRVRSAAVEHRAGLPQRDRHSPRARPPSIFRPVAQRRGRALHACRRAHGVRIHESLGPELHLRLGQRRLHASRDRGRSERRRRLRADGIRDGDRPSRPGPRRPRPGCRPAEHPLPPPPVLHLREEARRRAADRRSAR